MIKTLISIRLRALMSSLVNRKKGASAEKPSIGKIILFTLVYLYLAVVLVGMFAVLSSTMAPIMISAGLHDSYFGLFTVIAFSFVFVLSIFETKSEIFASRK